MMLEIWPNLLTQFLKIWYYRSRTSPTLDTQLSREYFSVATLSITYQFLKDYVDCREFGEEFG